MKECSSAIIIFTADEKYVDDNDIEIWRPSDNAIYEKGAASILYEKIVILKEKGVTLASDFSDNGIFLLKRMNLKQRLWNL